MDVGLALPQFDFSMPGERPLRWQTTVEFAQRAERLGFGSVWLADHLFFDVKKYGGPDEQFDCYDPLVGLSALASATERVRLGVLVISVPLRPPSVLAKALATVDVLSDGRLIAGLGAGNYEPEFVAAGVPFERPGIRMQRLDEAIDVVDGLFGGGPFTYDGEYYRTVAARCLPRPVQRPRPPIWLGGKGNRIIDMCARKADGWNTVWVWTREDYQERLDVLDQACERAGRDPKEVTRSLGLYTLVGEDRADLDRRFRRLQERSMPGLVEGMSLEEWRKGRLVGTVDEVREELAAWRALGVDSLVVSIAATPFSLVSADDLDVVAEACSLVAR